MTALSETAVLTAPRRGTLARFMATWRAALRPYAVLEARRNRLLYAGWPVVILGSLPLSAAIAMAADYPAAQGVAAALVGWVVGGLPLTAVLFGAVAGAGLRGAAEDAEAALPVSPRAKTLTALASAAASLAFSAALVAGLTLLVAPDASALLRAISELGSARWDAGRWTVLLSMGSALVSAPLGLLWLLTVSFGVSFVFAHAVLGGVAALFAGAAGLLPILAGLMLQLNTEARAGFLTAAVACSAALAAGALAALERAAAPALRGVRWSPRRILLLSMLPLAGSLAAWPALFGARDRALAATEQVWAPWDDTRRLSVRHDTKDFRRGLGGRLIREKNGKTVQLLPGWTPTLGDLVWGKRLSEVHGVFRDSDGTVWAEAWHPGTQGNRPIYEIWVGNGDGPLRRYMTLPDDTRFAVDDGRACIDQSPYSYASKDFVALDPAKPPILKSRR